MYSGIIRHKGIVVSRNDLPEGGAILRIEAGADFLDRIEPGSSVNVAGVCLTVVEKDVTGFMTDVMPQTLRLSTVSTWSNGDVVNVESSLRLVEELGGHMVFGHVDGVAQIVRRKADGNAELFTFKTEEGFVSRASVSLDGVSLTVSEASRGQFSVSLTQETLQRTTFGERKVGDVVNVEIDMLQRYVQQFYGTTDQSTHSSHP